MAKKQTRRSISVSRTTYEKLKAFCETNNISMSQFVETRVGDFLGEGSAPTLNLSIPTPPRPAMPAPMRSLPAISAAQPSPTPPKAEARPMPAPIPSAAARFAVEPPPPIIKPRQQEAAPKPAEKRADQIFTF